MTATETVAASGPSTYALDNAWVDARRRLTLLEECADPVTTGHLDRLGVGPGWRCLEVGAGGGSIARWLCRRVGPSGQVVAVDLDTRFVDTVDADNLEVHQRDIVADGLPGAGYDLIHTRAVLMHIPQRQRILEAMVAALRPGGWLLLEEADAYPLRSLTSGVYADGMQAATAALEAAGVAWEWARHLPRLLDEAGLEDVGAENEVPTFRGGSPWAELLQVSAAQLRPVVLASGLPAATLDALVAVLDDPRRWFSAWGFVSARGRRPAAV
jgi:SAM-dependent methyltransferase